MNALGHEGALERAGRVESCMEQGGAKEAEQEGVAKDKKRIIYKGVRTENH